MKRVVVTIDDMEPVHVEIARLLRLGKQAQVEVTTYRRGRSLSQLRTQHMWYGEIADQTGHSPEEVKELLKAEFGPALVVHVGDRERSVPKPSSEYTKAEAWEYMTRIQSWAGEWGLVLTNPEPEQVRQWRQELDDEREAAGADRLY